MHEGSFTDCDFFWLRLRFIFSCNGLHRSWWWCRSHTVWSLLLSHLQPICCDKRNHSRNQKKNAKCEGALRRQSHTFCSTQSSDRQIAFIFNQLSVSKTLQTTSRLHYMWISGFFVFLTPAYEVRGKVIFILGNVCLSTLVGKGYPIWLMGVPPSQVWMGVSPSQVRTGGRGYPFWLMGLPRSGWGYPLPRSGQEEGGTPIWLMMLPRYPFFRSGTPSWHGKGVPPVQTWEGGTPPDLGRGYHPQYRPGKCPPPIKKEGVPPIQVPGQDGNSMTCICYVAGGMPLAFTQEDFLVFFWLDFQPKWISAGLDFGFVGKFHSNKFMTNIDSNDEWPSYVIPF